jgi:hypothetical protein
MRLGSARERRTIEGNAEECGLWHSAGRDVAETVE